MLSRYSRREGFTLVEVMMVVAIIGMLAAIALPNFAIMQLRAKRSEVPLNLGAITVAEMAYFQEYGSFRVAPVEPRTDAELNTIKAKWPASAAGFDDIGWLPDGALYGNYAVTTVNTEPPGFSAYGACDVDNDDNVVYYFSSNVEKVVIGPGMSEFY